MHCLVSRDPQCPSSSPETWTSFLPRRLSSFSVLVASRPAWRRASKASFPFPWETRGWRWCAAKNVMAFQALVPITSKRPSTNLPQGLDNPLHVHYLAGVRIEGKRDINAWNYASVPRSTRHSLFFVPSSDEAQILNVCQPHPHCVSRVVAASCHTNKTYAFTSNCIIETIWYNAHIRTQLHPYGISFNLNMIYLFC